MQFNYIAEYNPGLVKEMKKDLISILKRKTKNIRKQ